DQLRTAKDAAEAAGNSAREATERLSLALSASRTGVWSWDVIHDQVIWDAHTHRMFGLAPENAGGTLWDLIAKVHADDRAEFTKSILGSTPGNEEVVVEFRVMWPDGTLHHIESRGQAFQDPSKRLIRRTGVVRDITEQRRLEEQLRQSQKMDAI